MTDENTPDHRNGYWHREEAGMTTRALFRQAMAYRREYDCGSAGHTIYTRTARKLYWIMRGVPVMEWKE